MDIEINCVKNYIDHSLYMSNILVYKLYNIGANCKAIHQSRSPPFTLLPINMQFDRFKALSCLCEASCGKYHCIGLCIVVNHYYYT